MRGALPIVLGGLFGMAYGAASVTLVAAAIAGLNLHLFGWLVDGAIGMVLIGLFMALVNGLLSLLAWIVGLVARLISRWHSARGVVDRLVRPALDVLRMPVLAIGLSVVFFLWLVPEDGPLSLFGGLVPFEIPVVAGGIVGLLAGIAVAARRWIALPALRRAVVGLTVVPALVLGTVVGAWAVLPGGGDPIVREDAATLALIPQLDLPDPSLAGPHQVVEATYGAGMPARRAEFTTGADWTTHTVDASRVLGTRAGPAAVYSDVLWGFETDDLPVNGLVWYPSVSPGAMPVVLLVHGNHAAGEFSDPGYAYLGRHLASRGMLAVSVDENFLNGDAFADYGGTEQGVRAWLLLEHLDQLRAWNEQSGHPLAGRIDLDRVALIGHSRGGEAVALAAAMNAGDLEISGMPDPAIGFGIRAVVGIAPSDGMYRGLGTPVELRDLDYLVLQGAHDGDLPGYSGLRTYHRVTFSGAGDHLKVAAYSQRANHGRFNSVWDTGDAGPVHSWMLDRGSLLSMDEQQHLARAVIGAFLARSLEGRTEYDAFFREPRAGRAWLPDDVLETHWETSARVVAIDLGADPIDDQPIVATGFDTVERRDPMLRDRTSQGDVAVHLGWSSPATFELAVTNDLSGMAAPGGWLTLSLGTANGSPVPNPVIVLTSANGESASLSLDAVAPARPVLPARLWKLDFLGDRYLPSEPMAWPAERFLQTYAIDLDRFAGVNPELDLAGIERIALRFQGSGEVFLDDVGFEPG